MHDNEAPLESYAGWGQILPLRSADALPSPPAVIFYRREHTWHDTRTSTQLLDEAESLARLGSWEWTIRTNAIDWSAGLLRIFGCAPGDVSPTLEGLMSRVHPEDRERVRATFESATRTACPFALQHRIILPPGDILDVECRGRVLVDGDGKATKVVGTAQDVTERKQAEDGRRQIELMHHSDFLKDQIINTLSHELRTPISVIAGFTSILQEELAGPLTADQQLYLAQIQGEADHLLKLINDMLELSQIQAGKLLLDARPVHLAEIAKDVLAQLMPAALAKQQRLVDDVPDDLPNVIADDARIAQVLTHLLLNAIKFAPEGTSTVVRARVDGEMLRCEVQDDGVEIPADEVPKLFQRFTQLDMSSTRRYGGVGIGLFISKALIEAHHGAIGLDGTPGQGNTFWFTLPIDAGPRP
jgi:PAS domain S-box-containing protein